MIFYENGSQTVEKSRSFFNSVKIFSQLRIQNGRHDLQVKRPKYTNLKKIGKTEFCLLG